jgi:hypothetical protein
MERNRNRLTRAADERFSKEMEMAEFELELAAGYKANAQLNAKMVEEFAHVDREEFCGEG